MNVYHYTTLEALKGILQRSKLCFWASRYDSMNDPTDYIYAREKIIPAIKRYCEEHKELFTEKNIEDVSIYPYILSTSALKDDINMWRLYHAEVMLELDWDLLKECCENDYLLHECQYANDDTIGQIFVDMYNDWEQSDCILNDCYEVAAFIKHEAYKPEKEYRIIKSDAQLFGCLGSAEEMYDGEIPHDIKVKCVRNGDYVLYKEFFFCKKILKSITVKCADQRKIDSIIQHIKLILQENDYPITKIEIKKSSSYPVLY